MKSHMLSNLYIILKAGKDLIIMVNTVRVEKEVFKKQSTRSKNSGSTILPEILKLKYMYWN